MNQEEYKNHCELRNKIRIEVGNSIIFLKDLSYNDLICKLSYHKVMQNYTYVKWCESEISFRDYIEEEFQNSLD